LVDMQLLLSKDVNSRGQVDLVDVQLLLSKDFNSRGHLASTIKIFTQQ
jgi:hypothetical protein